MHRCSVINCKNNTTDKVYFFNATILPNFDEIKDKLVVCKNPRICHIHFEFKWLNLKLKKGPFPTFFESSYNVYNINPAAAITPDHRKTYQTNSMLQQYQITSMLPMWEKNLNILKKSCQKQKTRLRSSNLGNAELTNVWYHCRRN